MQTADRKGNRISELVSKGNSVQGRDLVISHLLLLTSTGLYSILYGNHFGAL